MSSRAPFLSFTSKEKERGDQKGTPLLTGSFSRGGNLSLYSNPQLSTAKRLCPVTGQSPDRRFMFIIDDAHQRPCRHLPVVFHDDGALPVPVPLRLHGINSDEFKILYHKGSKWCIPGSYVFIDLMRFQFLPVNPVRCKGIINIRHRHYPGICCISRFQAKRISAPSYLMVAQSNVRRYQVQLPAFFSSSYPAGMLLFPHSSLSNWYGLL